MSFIARLAFISLAFLVIFALFQVRYDTLRRRDADAVSVSSWPKGCCRSLYSGVFPCVLPLGPVQPARDQLVKGEMRVGSTMHLFPVAFWLSTDRCLSRVLMYFLDYSSIVWLIPGRIDFFCTCHMIVFAVMIFLFLFYSFSFVVAVAVACFLKLDCCAMWESLTTLVRSVRPNSWKYMFSDYLVFWIDLCDVSRHFLFFSGLWFGDFAAPVHYSLRSDFLFGGLRQRLLLPRALPWQCLLRLYLRGLRQSG